MEITDAVLFDLFRPRVSRRALLPRLFAGAARTAGPNRRPFPRVGGRAVPDSVPSREHLGAGAMVLGILVAVFV